MNTKSLIVKLSKMFPKRIGERRDFLGLMTGKLKPETKKILVCLDFDYEVLPYVIKEKPDLILTHHPFIFGTKYRCMLSSERKAELIRIIDSLDIPVYSMHTNFDTGKGGMNDALASKLGLVDIKPLETNKMARGGILPNPMDVEDFAKYAKQCLNVESGKLVNAGKKEIRSVAIIGGGGWYVYSNAQKEGYDIFISGDIPHHGRRDVIMEQYNYLDLPHEIEKIFVPTMSNILRSIDSSLEIIEIDHEKEPKLI